MSAEELKALRKSTALPQRDFAIEMGVPLRTYENLESGSTAVRQVHLNAAKWAVVTILSIDDIGMTSVSREIKEIITKAAGNID